ncbi:MULTISPECIES: GapA-binding peptide SR1P [Fredinandcohnia]|uniref:GapA-binding peptide SR1P n=1 Tax=Fredinandcohnia salidurans TaxID=2595041 RepID=A0ABW4MIH9_9BACI|nr:GapA-binding peptide SR1P [Fredinandcohnia onubensis]
MGTIICQTCSETIEHFEYEKVTTLYSTCDHCDCNHEEK